MNNANPPITLGMLGASSFVGQALLQLLQSNQSNPLLAPPQNFKIIAFSRKAEREPTRSTPTCGAEIHWMPLHTMPTLAPRSIENWIVVSPIWTLAEHAAQMQRLGAKRIVALSSTSVITKVQSASQAEQTKMHLMLEAEQRFLDWGKTSGIQTHILRPTLIYGNAADQNLTEIARLIQRFGIFPLLGKANGARQPIHVEDVAQACLLCFQQALQHPEQLTKAIYTLSGRDVLCYKEMVAQIFTALKRPARFLPLPLPVFYTLVRLMNFIPRYRDWTPSMAERMNKDMAFSHKDARHDFGFQPRGFQLTAKDLPMP
ncbi:Hypothetical protein HDN1F_06830 [gamma proteobacterium HdN1]|nr:Hypothetical protein HDN1F_06830 [gamma proteobacterium HdN1]